MKQTNFEKSLIKGEVGEKIVKDIFERQGYVFYNPVTPGSHPFDFIAFKDFGDSEVETKIIIGDVKTKPRRSKYKDTGINLNCYNIYKNLSKTLQSRFMLFFVDENEGKIYGNTLKKLDEEFVADGQKYPWKWIAVGGNDIIYWHLDSMKTYHTLTEEEIKLIKHS